MNRTLKEMSRCMLLDGGCRPELWAHAIDTAAYLHNRSASSRNPNITPYELMWKERPDIRHLRVFGSWMMWMLSNVGRRNAPLIVQPKVLPIDLESGEFDELPAQKKPRSPWVSV